MTKKTPTRTCIACGTSAPKQGLLRVVKSPEGKVSVDPRGKAAGRGAYVCLDAACFEKAVSKHLFDSKLRKKLSAEEYESIQEDFEALSAMQSANAR